MKIAPYFPESSLIDAVMTNAPAAEPMKLSLVRLARAIEFDAAHGLGSPYPSEPDDPPPTYNALTVWYAYTHHPELSLPYDTSKRMYNDRRRKQAEARRPRR